MKVAVILSGCGVYDGSEIYETVLTLLALDKLAVQFQCYAPDMKQRHVVQHMTQAVSVIEERNVLTEAARLCRGDIKPLLTQTATQVDAAIYPGGFGVAKNLSDFAESAAQCEVQADVLAFGRAMATANKPQGFICIAPILIPRFYDSEVTCTIGNDTATALQLELMGAQHQECDALGVVVDEPHKVISTPAYMVTDKISEAAIGITTLVDKLLSFAQ